MNDPIYTVRDGIKIYNGTTNRSSAEFNDRISYWKQRINNNGLFAQLTPSTLTAQGKMSEVEFMEEEIIDMLSDPTGAIMKIGCNYGELINSEYEKPVIKKTSNRGRKPKPKKKSTRKVHGSGKYFNSQITFDIVHPVSKTTYKIKMFRNGVYQVPGVRDPSMSDLIQPIKILRDYLAENFAEDVQILRFMAVMRNNKTRVLKSNYHIHLEKLRLIIAQEKNALYYDQFVDGMLSSISSGCSEKIKRMINGWNPMNIAEITYNTDRCFALIIKFYRPSILKPDKKTTVKFLKKMGKINFDGGNSQQEIEELYYWLHYIYQKHHDTIIFDMEQLNTDTPSDLSDCSQPSIYDDDDNYVDEENNIETEEQIEYQKALDRDMERRLIMNPESDSLLQMRNAIMRSKVRDKK